MDHDIVATHLTKTYKVREVKKSGGIMQFFQTRYSDHTALSDVSFTVDKGEVMGMVGPNGAGKTTTMKMLSGILYPTSGSIQIRGFVPFEKKHAFLRQISFVMGRKNQLIWDLPAIDTFQLNKEIYELDDLSYKRSLGTLLDFLDAHELIHRPVKTLSLGQRMRLELVAALLHNPSILFLDEPTLGLDIVVHSSIVRFLQEYRQEFHPTILLSSHDMRDVEQLTNRLMLVNKGRVVYQGTLHALVRSYGTHKRIRVVREKSYVLPERLKKLVIIDTFPLLELRIKRSELEDTVSLLLSGGKCTDLTVENEQIEKVIEEVLSINSL
ncbi:MAG: ATP-binding cassette domain-containing protein [Candidatus Roizmanbacteria bacterium]|nr:ATP-binding cassette domain-containing protein [Candidatus Roizmanbacteria bacterium]